MKYKLVLGSIFLTATTLLSAPGDAVPNTFVNGNVADATHVNANFTELVNQIATLKSQIDAMSVTTYDIKDYIKQTNHSKTFTVTDSAGVYNKEIKTYDWSVSGQYSFTRDRLLNSTRVFYHTLKFDLTDDRRLVEVKIHSPSTLSVVDTRTMAPGILFDKSAMHLGKTFGSDSTLTSTTSGISGVYQLGTLINSNVTVTVPAGTFTSCIQVSMMRSASNLATRHNTINTFCPNLGLVRQLYTEPDYTNDSVRSVIKELSLCNGGACQ